MSELITKYNNLQEETHIIRGKNSLKDRRDMYKEKSIYYSKFKKYLK